MVVIVVMAAAAVTVVARQGVADWRDLPRAAFHFDGRYLAASWGVQTLGWLLSVAIWRRIVRGVGAPEVGYRRHLVAYTWSGLGNVIPGSVWLPATRLALYRRYGVPAFAVSTALVIEWLVVGLAGVGLYAASAPFATAFSNAGVVPLAIAAVVALGVLHPRVFQYGLQMASRRFQSHSETGPRGAHVPEPGDRDPQPSGVPTPAAALRPMQAAVLTLGEAVVLTAAGIGFFLMMRAVAPAASLGDALNAWALSVAVANLLAWMPATVLFKDGAMALALVPLYGSLVVAVGVVVAWRLWMTIELLSWGIIASAVAKAAHIAPPVVPGAPTPKE